jgi:hypothetical protein
MTGPFVTGKLSGSSCLVQSKSTADKEGNWHYQGQMKEGRFNGQGSFAGNLGSISYSSKYGTYTGPFVDGYPEGEGRMTFENDETWYVGGFSAGLFDGTGTLRSPNGVRFAGPWKKNNPNGVIHIYKYTLLGLVREDKE